MPDRPQPGPLLVTSLVAASLLPLIQAGLMAPTLQAIHGDLLGGAGLQVTVGALLVAPTVVVVLSAYWICCLVDRLAKAPVLVGAIAAYAVLSLLSGMARSFAELLAFRALLGFALAAVVTTSGALIGDLLTGEARAAALGRQAVLRGVSAAIAPVVGGIAAGFHWRLSLLVNTLALALLPGLARLPGRPRSDVGLTRRLDVKSVAGPYLAIFVGWLVLYLLTLQIGFHLKSLGAVEPIWPGLALGASSLAAALAGTRLARLQARYSFRGLTSLALAVMAAGYLLISLSSRLSTSVGIVLAGGSSIACTGVGPAAAIIARLIRVEPRFPQQGRDTTG